MAKEMSREELAQYAPKPVDGLKELTLKGIADCIKEGHAKKVIIMQGAGISVAAGISAFRGPTGLFSQLDKYDLPYPEAIFDIDYFPEHPEAFFDLNKQLMPGNYKPTIAHWFARLLHDKGVLKRLFTQNIDGLERATKIPAEMVCEAHGHFYTSHCLDCGKEYSLDELRADFDTGEVVYCKAKKCNGLVKPDIVFYGENLPDRFHKLVKQDFPKCDLLIIMGTSLKVYPFAGLIGDVAPEVPRLLINMEKTSQVYKENVFLPTKEPRVLSDTREKNNFPKFKFGHLTNRRDVWAGGDCQKSVSQLVELLGWSEDFKKLLPEELKATFEEYLNEKEPESEPEVNH